MELTDTDLDDLVRAIDPFPASAGEAAALTPALDDLLTSMTAPSPRPSRPRRRAVVALAATGLLTVGGVAAATTRDHWVGNTAPDFATSVRAATADLPLPPGDDIDQYIALWSRGPSGELDRDTLIVYFSYDAVCAWQGYWLQERTTTDVTAAARALHMLEAIPDWPQWTGNTDDSTTDSYRTDAEQAASGNPGPVRQDWTANCTSLPRAWATK